MDTVKIENYTILKTIGIGGSGRVFLARHNDMERIVAIKVVKCASQETSCEESSNRCFQEAKILAMIDHPNIMSIHDFGRTDIDGELYCYLVLEYLEKGSLEKKIAQSSYVNEIEIWKLMYESCLGLQIAVENEVIHRDIKPANILLSKSGHAKVGDFGIAKKLKTNKNITEKGYILGTPSFIAPETAKSGTNTFKSDIYGLGLTAYFCLTKIMPFAQDNIIATLVSHTVDRIEAPMTYHSELTLSSNLIIAKMIQKNPEDRYESYGDLLADIENLLHKLPLEFAHIRDCKKIYSEQSLKCILKKRTNTSLFQKIKRSISRKKVVFDNIIITTVWDVVKRKKVRIENVHYIKSLIEIEYFLHKHSKKNNIIVIDIDYQKEVSVVIFELIRKKFPKVNVAFSTERIAKENKMAILCEDDELVSYLKCGKVCKARDIDLLQVAKLVNINSWSIGFEKEGDEIKSFCVIDKSQTTKVDIPQENKDSEN